MGGQCKAGYVGAAQVGNLLGGARAVCGYGDVDQ